MARAFEPTGEPARLIPQQRPRVWLLADRRDWAYDVEARAMATLLADSFECRIAYAAEQPDLAAWPFDLVWVFFWGETWHQRFTSDPRRVVKMVGSHRWQNEAAYGLLDPASFVQRYLHDAGHVAAISERLVRLLRPFRPIHHAPQGIDPERFHGGTAIKGPLRTGFAGNASDPCKGLFSVLQPACAGRFDLRVAGGDLLPPAMGDFYRQLDVLAVASDAEGGPLPLLEALACGAFVVSTDVGVASEVIRHGDNGLVVARDPAAFRAALHWCEANLQRLRAGAVERASSLHAVRTWAHTMPLRARILRQAMRELQPGAAIAELQTSYRDHLQKVSPADEATYAAASEYYRAELGPVLPAQRDLRIVELGCGFGHLLRFLAASGYQDLTGVDLDADLAAATRSRLGKRAAIHCQDATAFLAAHPSAFDFVLAYDILEHFDLDSALALARAVHAALRPGGRVVFRTPNMANILGAYSRYLDLTHRIGFTEQSAVQLLRAAGFTDVSLVEPVHTGVMAERTAENRRFHEQLFRLQDRSMPTCFDKNLVVVAATSTAVATCHRATAALAKS